MKKNRLFVYFFYKFSFTSFFVIINTVPTDDSPNNASINAKFISAVFGFSIISGTTSVTMLLLPTKPYVLRCVVVNTNLPLTNLASKVSTNFPSSSKYTTL